MVAVGCCVWQSSFPEQGLGQGLGCSLPEMFLTAPGTCQSWKGSVAALDSSALAGHVFLAHSWLLAAILCTLFSCPKSLPMLQQHSWSLQIQVCADLAL